MTHSEIEETIAAYALGSLGGDERRAVERELLDHIAGCDGCRRTFRELREAAGDLAMAVRPEPLPAGLEERVMAEVRGGAKAEPPARHRASRGIAAAAIAAVVALGAWNVRIARDLDDARADADRARAVAALLADPAADRRSLEGAAGDSQAVLAIGRDRTAALVGAFPALRDDQVLELWLLRDGTPIPAAVLRPRDRYAFFALLATPAGDDRFAITIEPGPDGSPAPTTEPIYREGA